MKKQVKCSNVGVCTRAGKVFVVDDEEQQEMVCPECGEPLEEVKEAVQIPVDDEESKKKKKRIITIAAAVIGVGAIGGCIYYALNSKDSGCIPPPPPPAISLNHSEKTLKVGETDTLIATITPEDTQATIVWKASKDGNVEVQDGIVKAVKGGSGKVRVQAIVGKDTLSAICKYTIESVENSDFRFITTLTVEGGDLSLKVGESKPLSYVADPQENDENISWSSSDTNVVSVVPETGHVKAQKEGTATITATSDKSMKQASVKITVTKKNTGVEPPRGRYHGTLSLGYGNYSGDILNGKPDGAGVLTYTSKGQHKAGRNFKTGEDVYAESGERVDGTWNNGYLSSGTLFKRDGNAIKIKN